MKLWREWADRSEQPSGPRCAPGVCRFIPLFRPHHDCLSCCYSHLADGEPEAGVVSQPTFSASHLSWPKFPSKQSINKDLLAGTVPGRGPVEGGRGIKGNERGKKEWQIDCYGICHFQRQLGSLSKSPSEELVKRFSKFSTWATRKKPFPQDLSPHWLRSSLVGVDPSLFRPAQDWGEQDRPPQNTPRWRIDYFYFELKLLKKQSMKEAQSDPSLSPWKQETCPPCERFPPCTQRVEGILITRDRKFKALIPLHQFTTASMNSFVLLILH